MAVSRLVMEFVAGDLASATLTRIAGKVRQLGDEGERMAARLEASAQRFDRGLKAFATARHLGSTYLAPGLAAAADMDAAMKRLQANLDPGADPTPTLAAARSDAERIAAITKFDATGVLGDVVVEQLKAGLRLPDVLGRGGAAESAAYLAQAEETDLATANQAVLDGVAKFGLAGDEIGKFADLLKRYSAASSASVASLDEGLKYLSGLGELGIGTEDTLSLLSLLDAQGLRGSMGGTSLQEFLSRMTRADKASPQLDFYDTAGTFKGIDEVTRQLRAFFGGMNQEQRQIAADKLFGTQGSRVLFALLNQGDKSLEGVRAGAAGSRTLADTVSLMATGTTQAWQAAQGTMVSTMATLFEPLNGPSRAIADLANSAAASIGAAARENPALAQGVSYGSAGAVGALGAYGIFQMARGGVGALGALRGIASLPGAGTAAGIAQGKAIEAATGVAPVFVTNWPGGGTSALGTGAAASGTQAVAGGAAAGGAATLASRLGYGALAAAGGYAVGTAINESAIRGTKAETVIQGLLGYWVNTPMGRMVTGSDTQKAGEDSQKAMLQALREMGVKVNIYLDRDGNFRTVSEGAGELEVAARRLGAP